MLSIVRSSDAYYNVESDFVISPQYFVLEITLLRLALLFGLLRVIRSSSVQ